MADQAVSDPRALTPVQGPFDGIYLKREDLFQVHGAVGAKARTCWHFLGEGEVVHRGLTTGASRVSPQIQIVARIAHGLDAVTKV